LHNPLTWISDGELVKDKNHALKTSLLPSGEEYVLCMDDQSYLLHHDLQNQIKSNRIPSLGPILDAVPS
jgi:hypothetical protein